MFSLNGRIRATAIAGLIAASGLAARRMRMKRATCHSGWASRGSPSSNNGTVLDGSVKLDVINTVRPSFTLGYMVTPLASNCWAPGHPA